MSIVGGLDVHRNQITCDWVDLRTGEAGRGRVAPAERDVFRSWLRQLPPGDAAFAVGACTGWRFVVEELTAEGFAAYLAEPADTSTLRGCKKRAKTGRADARLQREQLEQGRLPESWVPPAHILDLRELVRLRKTLGDQRVQWQQRIHAVLFPHGLPGPPRALSADATRCWLAGYTRRQPGCRALAGQLFGVGPVTAATIVAELGDARRFRNGDAVVGHAGLDVTVYSSDGKRSPGHLSRQGPEVLRWVFESARCASRTAAPGHPYYSHVWDRLTSSRATLSVARKLVRRARHILAGLGDDALAPVDPALLPPLPPAMRLAA